MPILFRIPCPGVSGECLFLSGFLGQAFPVNACLWGAFDFLWADFGLPLAPFGVPLGSLWPSFGIPLAVLGHLWDSLGAPWAALGNLLDFVENWMSFSE